MEKRKITSQIFLLGLFLAVVLAIPPIAVQATEVHDFRGRVTNLPKPAERVVCLIESALSGLYMLGAQNKVVAVSTNVYQEEVFRYYAAMDPRIAGKALPTPGNWDFVNIESVVALQPDLVIIWASQTEAIDALVDKGVAVYAVELHSFEDVFKEIHDLGVLFGKEARAGELLDNAAKELAALAESRTGLAEGDRPGVYFMWAQGAMETSGAPSTVNDLIELAGGRNVAGHMRQEHLVINPEHILTWQPLVIVMWRNPKLSPKDLAAMPVWRSLPAAKTGRVHELPSVFYCDLWTLKFLHAIKLIATWCQPDKFPMLDSSGAKRDLLKVLYGAELGERIPLDE